MGIVTDVRPVQRENAPFATLVMVVEMTMSPLQHAPFWEVLSTQPVVFRTVGAAVGAAVGTRGILKCIFKVDGVQSVCDDLVT